MIVWFNEYLLKRFLNLLDKNTNWLPADKTALYKTSFVLLPPFFNHPGLSINRLDPPSLSDGGDVSPVGLVVGLTLGEPISPIDTPTEENLERDR